jgi:undecaprenyl diphosphate synthase
MKMEQQNSQIPSHVVLFPDGNRRWARERELSVFEGYREGRKNFQQFLLHCKKRGIKIVTVFGFSTENWQRPKEEVEFLMVFLEESLSGKEELAFFQQEGIRVNIIGQKERFPSSLQEAIANVEGLTKQNTELFLNLAASYGGRWDIAQAVQRIVKDGIAPKAITEELISSYLTTAGLPEPDLVIRAGGEKRFSNFLLWQSAYAELYFSDKYWPAFTEQDLDEVFAEYTRRQRRFGS